MNPFGGGVYPSPFPALDNPPFVWRLPNEVFAVQVLEYLWNFGSLWGAFGLTLEALGVIVVGISWEVSGTS